jgi:hypothetical protein
MRTHARAGIPWPSVLAAAAPGLLMVGLAFGFGDRPWAARLAQAGLLLLAVPAALLLDDPPAAAVEATPRSPWWGLAARLLGLAAVIAVICATALAWALVRPTEQAWLLAALPTGGALAVVAAAAVLRRSGRLAPGDVAAAAAAVLLLGLLVFSPRWQGLEIVPAPGSADPGEIALWALAAAAAAGLLAWAPSGRPPRAALDA